MNAGRGFADAVLGGKNMKIHLMAAAWALILVWTSGYGRDYYIAVLVACALVIGAECFNSAIEKLCDRVTTEKDEFVRAAKDMAAGAVLICAIVAVAIGLFLFVDKDFWLAVLKGIGEGKGWAAVAIGLLPPAALVLAVMKPKPGTVAEFEESEAAAESVAVAGAAAEAAEHASSGGTTAAADAGENVSTNEKIAVGSAENEVEK